MKITVYNPTNERIGLFCRNQRVVIPPKGSVIVSEKVGKAILAKDDRLTRSEVSYSQDQIRRVDGMKKGALVVLAKSLMRGIQITPEEAALQADRGLPVPAGLDETDEQLAQDAN